MTALLERCECCKMVPEYIFIAGIFTGMIISIMSYILGNQKDSWPIWPLFAVLIGITIGTIFLVWKKRKMGGD